MTGLELLRALKEEGLCRTPVYMMSSDVSDELIQEAYNAGAKEVTKREVNKGWKNWKWRSSKDVFQNGAYFVQSGWGSCYPSYTPSQSFPVAQGSMVPALTSSAGPLRCLLGKPC